jgi:adenylate kinase family enzyme
MVTTQQLSPRIVVIGSSCAGKSTFAQALAETRACKYIELDELFWGPDWTPKPEPEFLSLVASSAAADDWVAAGNYSLARPLLWSRATTIVWLNFSLPLVLWRGLKRTVARNVRGEVLFHGNRESFKRAFLSRESILWWIASTYRRRQREFLALRESAEFQHVEWLEARNPRAADQVLRELQNARC